MTAPAVFAPLVGAWVHDHRACQPRALADATHGFFWASSGLLLGFFFFLLALAYFSSCANFPHYATASAFAKQPSLLLHDVNGSLLHTHVPGFTWPGL
jgi:hypothetical protein